MLWERLGSLCSPTGRHLGALGFLLLVLVDDFGEENVRSSRRGKVTAHLVKVLAAGRSGKSTAQLHRLPSPGPALGRMGSARGCGHGKESPAAPGSEQGLKHAPSPRGSRAGGGARLPQEPANRQEGERKADTATSQGRAPGKTAADNKRRSPTARPGTILPWLRGR